MSRPKRPRRVCPACRMELTVLRDGRLNKHNGPSGNPCAGSLRDLGEVRREVESTFRTIDRNVASRVVLEAPANADELKKTIERKRELATSRARVGHGSTAQRLVKRLASLGWTVIQGPYGADGGNRRWAYLDDTTVCWEAYAKHPEHAPYQAHLVSYDTMTDCARGCSLDTTGYRDNSQWWVTADKPSPRNHGQPRRGS